MQSFPLADALAIVALTLGGVAVAFAFLGGRRAGDAGRKGLSLAIFFAATSVAMLGGAVLALSAGAQIDDTGARRDIAVVHDRAATIETAGRKLEERVDEVAEGLRTELNARDSHTTRVEERLQSLTQDVHDLQVANTALRRMLVDVADTSGLLITREGRYVLGPDATTFTPCGWGEAWDLEFSPADEARERLVDLLAGRREATVSFTGVLSTPGDFGQSGSLRHLFLVVDGAPVDGATDCL